MADTAKGKRTTKTILAKVLSERSQGPDTRQGLISRLQKKLGRCVVTYFTSFRYPVMIVDNDAEMIEDVLRACDLANGLSLVLNSPGGDALAAERIIQICRTYSGGDFEVIVPRKAMSAATVISFGAKRLWMAATAVLGSVDPQAIEEVQDKLRVMPIRTALRTYKELLKKALETPRENVAPLLQQLDRYDARKVGEWEDAEAVCADIAVKALQGGLMAGKPEKDIRSCMKRFIEPPKAHDHARGIPIKEARECGLSVEELAPEDDVSDMLWELYVRSNSYVSMEASKVVETTKKSYIVGIPSHDDTQRGEP